MGLGLLAHCGAKWWACDGGSAVGFLVFVGWCVIGLRRLERRTEARAAAYREAQRLRSELSAATSSLDDPGAPAEPHASDRTD